MSAKRWCFIFVSVVLLMSSLKDGFAQGLGRFSDWSEPVNLGPNINSEFIEQSPMISPSGLSLYFASNRPGGLGSTDFWVSQRASLADAWMEPKHLGPIINTPSNETNPNLSPDGHWLFFSSARPGGCGNNDLWISYREDSADNFGWKIPQNLGCIINTDAAEFGPAYFEDATTGVSALYFHSNGLGA